MLSAKHRLYSSEYFYLASPVRRSTRSRQNSTGREISFQTVAVRGVLVALTLALSGCYEKPVAQKEVQAIPVRTAKVETKDVQLYSYFNGRTDVNPIQIVPRIRGVLEKIEFKPGDLVDAGTPLFVIEEFDYQNAVEGSQADLASAKANEAKTKADYDRNIKLRDESGVIGAITQEEIDASKANWEDAQAKVAKAESQLADSLKQLDRTTIKAPMRGKISRNLVEVGNLVDGSGANPPTLATIMPMDTMYVYFEITNSVFNYIQQKIRAAVDDKLQEKNVDPASQKNKAILEIADEQGLSSTLGFEMGLLVDHWEKSNDPYPFHGTIDYNDNIIDRNTGTITIRGKIDNSDYMLYPGFICRVKIPGEIVENAVLVQEKAICYDLNDVFIWVLDNENKPQKRTVDLGEPLEDGTRIIASGLQGDETYILDGTQKVKTGVPIKEIE